MGKGEIYMLGKNQFSYKHSILVAIIIAELCSWLTYIPDLLQNEYLFSISAILTRILLCIFIIMLSKHWGIIDLIQFTGKSFGTGILSGMFCLVLSCWVIFTNVLGIINSNPEELSYPALGIFILFIIRVLMIGAFEELAYRGFLLNIIIQKYGDSRKSLYTAAILSSLAFGLGHYSNLIYTPFISTTSQVIGAFCMGMFFAAVYLRSKNIWVCAFLHALWNFANMFTSKFESSTNAAAVITDITIPQLFASLIEPAIFLLIAIFLLRKSKLSSTNKLAA